MASGACPKSTVAALGITQRTVERYAKEWIKRPRHERPQRTRG
ncbi:hypothetical protein [Streptomyces sp. ISL-36]|nr:hypothetical protein [Streptomyces sp. ISL-36]